MTKMLLITLAMLGGALFATASEANFSATGDALAEMMACVGQCPIDPKSMSPSYWCVTKKCFTQLGRCAFDWTCRKTLKCETECTSALVGVDGANEFTDVSQCLTDNCPGSPPSVGCIAKNCKMVAAKCALKSNCRHALECAKKCQPSVVDVGLSKTEDDEELMVTDHENDDPTTTSETMSCISQCPLDPDTMTPSYWCVVQRCFKKVGKCVFNSECRNALKCVAKCPAPLAKTENALRFIELGTCVSGRCPGFPPSKLCLAAHCTSEAAKCGIHSACRDALMCANKCSSTVGETNKTIVV